MSLQFLWIVVVIQDVRHSLGTDDNTRSYHESWGERVGCGYGQNCCPQGTVSTGLRCSTDRYRSTVLGDFLELTFYDERADIIADVHTDPNTDQVLEEGMGSPFSIYVVIKDCKGRRICRGSVFSYYEFKHPVRDRLTDEKWQEMGKRNSRPPQPDWVRSCHVQRLLEQD